MMKCKLLLVVSTFVLGHATALPMRTPTVGQRQANSCSGADRLKVDCDVVGIQACERKGCCWAGSNSSVPVPWCFYASGTNCFGLHTDMEMPFNTTELSVMMRYFVANINIQVRITFQYRDMHRVRVPVP